MTGLITKSTGSAYGVLLDNGNSIEAHVKGNFRIKGIRSTNPVAVGDNVEVETLPDGTNWITEIHDRRNYIIRRSTNLSKQSHILAANIDQAALLVTINHPVTATTFIDRFLATCEAYRVPAILIFNKIDLLNEDELGEMEYLRMLYGHLGYATFAISAKALHGELNEIFHGKTTLLSGNSGVGKSTLLNAMFGVEKTKTSAISDAHNQGRHTTTFSEMYFLEETSKQTTIDEIANKTANEIADNESACRPTAIIDTPGIRGFGTFDFQKEEVGHYFKEIFAESQNCRFGNCTHTNEPGCSVLQAVEAGHIAYSRYESYLSLLDDCVNPFGDAEKGRRDKRYR